jgi:hypothetical protein
MKCGSGLPDLTDEKRIFHNQVKRFSLHAPISLEGSVSPLDDEKLISLPLNLTAEEAEKRFILAVYEKSKQNKTITAKRLQIGLKTLYRKMYKWDVIIKNDKPIGKMFAIPFGTDGTTGDSDFYPDASLEYFQDEEFISVFNRYIKSLDPEDKDEFEKPVGFWIIDEKTKKMINIVWKSNLGNDNSTYACNHTVKEICKQMSIKTIENHLMNKTTKKTKKTGER